VVRCQLAVASKLIGVGFGELPSAANITNIEAHFRARNEPLQAEVATLADPAFGALLTSQAC
jgi:hypothetical protein